MPSNSLSPAQHEVLERISAGVTLQTAADAVGVHRNTISNWRRSSSHFQKAWESMQFEQAMHWREQCLPLAPLAIDAIRNILEDPETKPALRLRAALAIHKIVSTPPPAQPERKRALDWNALLSLPIPARAADPDGDVHNESMHNDAQPDPPPPASPEASAASTPAGEAPVQPESMHKDAQSRAAAARAMREINLTPEDFQPLTPRIGRNQPCPCQSGRKWKHCCIHKAAAPSTALSAQR